MSTPYVISASTEALIINPRVFIGNTYIVKRLSHIPLCTHVASTTSAHHTPLLIIDGGNRVCFESDEYAGHHIVVGCVDNGLYHWGLNTNIQATFTPGIACTAYELDGRIHLCAINGRCVLCGLAGGPVYTATVPIQPLSSPGDNYSTTDVTRIADIRIMNSRWAGDLHEARQIGDSVGATYDSCMSTLYRTMFDSYADPAVKLENPGAAGSLEKEIDAIRKKTLEKIAILDAKKASADEVRQHADGIREEAKRIRESEVERKAIETNQTLLDKIRSTMSEIERYSGEAKSINSELDRLHFVALAGAAVCNRAEADVARLDIKLTECLRALKQLHKDDIKIQSKPDANFRAVFQNRLRRSLVGVNLDPLYRDNLKKLAMECDQASIPYQRIKSTYAVYRADGERVSLTSQLLDAHVKYRTGASESNAASTRMFVINTRLQKVSGSLNKLRASLIGYVTQFVDKFGLIDFGGREVNRDNLRDFVGENQPIPILKVHKEKPIQPLKTTPPNAITLEAMSQEFQARQDPEVGLDRARGTYDGAVSEFERMCQRYGVDLVDMPPVRPGGGGGGGGGGGSGGGGGGGGDSKYGPDIIKRLEEIRDAILRLRGGIGSGADIARLMTTTNDEYEELKRQYAELLAERDRLRTRNDDKDQLIREVHDVMGSMSRVIDDLNKANRDLLSELDETKRAVLSGQAQIAALRAQQEAIFFLAEQCRKFFRRLKKSKRRFDDRKRDNESDDDDDGGGDIPQPISDATLMMGRIDELFSSYEDAVDAQQGVLDSMRSSQQETRDEVERLRADLRQLINSPNIPEDVQRRLREVAELEVRCSTHEREISELHTQLERQRVEFERSIEEKEHSFRDELDQLLGKHTRELSAAEAERHRMEQDFDARVNELTTQLQAAYGDARREHQQAIDLLMDQHNEALAAARAEHDRLVAEHREQLLRLSIENVAAGDAAQGGIDAIIQRLCQIYNIDVQDGVDASTLLGMVEQIVAEQKAEAVRLNVQLNTQHTEIARLADLYNGAALEIEQLNSEVGRLSELYANSTRQVENLSRARDDLKASIDRIRSDMVQLTSVNQDLQLRVQEMDQLQSELEAAHGVFAEQDNEMKRLAAENERLVEELRGATETKRRIEVYERSVEHLRATNRQLEATIEEQRTEIAAIASLNDRLTSRNNRLATSKTNLEAQVQQLTEQLALLDRQLDDKEQIVADLARARERIETLDNSSVHAWAEVDKAEADSKRLERELVDNQRSLAIATQDARNAERERDEAAGRLAEIRAERATSTAELTQANARIDTLNLELARLRGERESSLSALQEQLDTSRTGFESKNNQLAQQLAESHRNSTALRERVRELESRLASAQQRGISSERVAELENKLRDLEQKRDELTSLVGAYERRLKDDNYLDAVSDLAAANARVATLTESLQQLRDTCRELRSDATTTQQTIHALEADKMALADEIAQRDTLLNDLTIQLGTLRQQFDGIARLKADLQGQLHNAQVENQQLRARNVARVSQSPRPSVDNSVALRVENQRLGEDSAALRAENQRLGTQLTTLQDAISQLRATNMRIERSMGANRSTNEKTIADLQQRLNERDQIIARMSNEREQAVATFNARMASTTLEYQRRVQNLDIEKTRLIATLAEMKQADVNMGEGDRIRALEARLHEALVTNDSMNAQLRSLHTSAPAAAATIRELTAAGESMQNEIKRLQAVAATATSTQAEKDSIITSLLTRNNVLTRQLSEAEDKNRELMQTNMSFVHAVEAHTRIGFASAISSSQGAITAVEAQQQVTRSASAAERIIAELYGNLNSIEASPDAIELGSAISRFSECVDALARHREGNLRKLVDVFDTCRRVLPTLRAIDAQISRVDSVTSASILRDASAAGSDSDAVSEVGRRRVSDSSVVRETSRQVRTSVQDVLRHASNVYTSSRGHSAISPEMSPIQDTVLFDLASVVAGIRSVSYVGVDMLNAEREKIIKTLSVDGLQPENKAELEQFESIVFDASDVPLPNIAALLEKLTSIPLRTDSYSTPITQAVAKMRAISGVFMGQSVTA